VVIRPIRPEDEPLLVTFHSTLSERSVALRYFHAMKYTTRVGPSPTSGGGTGRGFQRTLVQPAAS
jgi:hypothetical protein